MAKPFVSHDGADEQGVRAEVWVQVGTGTVTGIENRDEETKRNVMVVLKSDNSRVSRPVTAWLAKDDPTYPEVLRAHETGREVRYRVESQRKPGVDRSTPIADLRVDMATAGANTVSIFAGIDGLLSREAVTDPAEDPGPGGRLRAAGTAGRGQRAGEAPAGAGPGLEAALSGLATARRAGLPAGVVDAAAALALAAGATAQQVADAGFTGQSTTPRGERRRAFAHEAAPHLPLNSDQRVNLGSYAVQAAFSAERVAHDLLAGAAQHAPAAPAGTTGEPDGEPEGTQEGTPQADGAVDLAQVARLAGVLLTLADRVQVGAYGGGRPDRMANSHTRARALVYDAVRTRHPVPSGGEGHEAWAAAVVAEGVERFRALVALSQQVAEVPAPSGGDDGDGGGTAGSPAPQGSPGSAAPTAQAMKRYRDLALAAGFPATPDSPALEFLRVKFGVGAVRQVRGEALESLLTWFEGQRRPGEAFRSYVESAIAAARRGTRGEQRTGHAQAPALKGGATAPEAVAHGALGAA
ncbi:hypothetical protein [Kineococcus sp. SYSU DK005]|uniref:hypothetical protein n=1 Tax=Kineococcus sp. SYSU DK005 TaxID=3383126 RepID=UPI003D7E8165